MSTIKVMAREASKSGVTDANIIEVYYGIFWRETY
jgi:hypothetical protein